MTSLIVGSFFGAATAAILAEAGLEFLGLGDSSDRQLGHDALLGAELQRAAHRPVGRCCSPPVSASPCSRLSLTLINFGVDGISNPRLREGKGTMNAMTARPNASAPDDVAPRGPRPVRRLRVRRRRRRSRRSTTSRSRSRRGEFVGLVGESGFGQVDARLRADPAAEAAGPHQRRPHPVRRHATSASSTPRTLREQRQGGFAMVLQSGMNALNPVRTHPQPLRRHLHGARPRAARRAGTPGRRELIGKVELPPRCSTASRASSPAACASASRSRSPCRSSRSSWCSTSRRRRSTCSCSTP